MGMLELVLKKDQWTGLPLKVNKGPSALAHVDTHPEAKDVTRASIGPHSALGCHLKLLIRFQKTWRLRAPRLGYDS